MYHLTLEDAEVAKCIVRGANCVRFIDGTTGVRFDDPAEEDVRLPSATILSTSMGKRYAPVQLPTWEYNRDGRMWPDGCIVIYGYVMRFHNGRIGLRFSDKDVLLPLPSRQWCCIYM